MDKFYIQKIVARGSGKTDSSVSFEPGLNIIQGRSNTGKTCIIRCIDFVFGGKKLPFDESFGYTEVEMTLCTPVGKAILTRQIHKNQVEVISEIDGWESGTYDIKRNPKKKKQLPILGDFLLNSIGIPIPIEIIKNTDFERRKLSFRTFLHMLMFDSNTIGQEESIIEPSDRNEKTPFLSALLYLLTGENQSEEAAKTKKEIRVAKRNAVEEYVHKNISRITEKRDELSQQLLSFEGIDVERELQAILDALHETEAEIMAAVTQSKKLLSDIMQLQEQSSECNLLISRYASLRTQYVADIKRLSFIVDGEEEHKHIPANTTCPFCDGKIPVRNRISYIESSKAELARIMSQMNGLDETEKEVLAEKEEIASQLNTLVEQRTNIEELINSELQPKAEQFRNTIQGYRTYLQIHNELQVIARFANSWEDDLRNLPSVEESKVKYHPKEYFDTEFSERIDSYYKDILTECSYVPTPLTTRFNLQDFDIEIDGHKKSGYQGQGYCSFVNTITALVFRYYLSKHAKYDPGFLIVDTPLLGLDQGVDDAAPESMRTALFRYFMNHQDDGQTIVIENILHIPKLDYEASGANVITFTKGLSDGRYGFLMDVK